MKELFPTEPIEEDGGFRTYTDPDAPKTVADSRITAFFCNFSTLTMAEEILGNRNYRLEANLSGDSVTGLYHSYDRFGGRSNRTLLADTAFMEQLQSIVSRHALASYNGGHTRCYGIAPDYGSCIRIIYASGEEIHASDDQGCFLPLAALVELEALFREKTEKERL